MGNRPTGYDNTSVRRQDRLLDGERALEILHKGEYGFLAVAGGQGAYGIPMNYVFEGGCIYFHCAPEGEKLSRIAENRRVSFCVVGGAHPVPSMFTTEYESVMSFGSIGIVCDDTERMHALGLLVRKYSPQFIETGMKYAGKSFTRTVILRMDIETTSGKCKRIYNP